MRRLDLLVLLIWSWSTEIESCHVDGDDTESRWVTSKEGACTPDCCMPERSDTRVVTEVSIMR